MAPSDFQLAPPDLPLDTAARLSRACRERLGEAAEFVLFRSRLTPPQVRASLMPPTRGIVEVAAAADYFPHEVFLRHLGLGGLGLALTTATAHLCDPAFAFIDALVQQHPQWRVRLDDLALVLHEAVTNAIVHGNLEVETPSTDLEGFHRYCQELDEALDDSRRAGRHVEISAALAGDGGLELAVRDYGKGFVPSPLETDGTEPRQHGLAIISSRAEMRFADEGRCVIIRFRDVAP